MSEESLASENGTKSLRSLLTKLINYDKRKETEHRKHHYAERYDDLRHHQRQSAHYGLYVH